MTGFARAERQAGPVRIRIEIKSVNGRGLDMRLRLPPGLDAVDIPLRQALSRALNRGSLNLALTLDRTGGAGTVRINNQALAGVLAALDELRTKATVSMPQPEGILALPGVLELDDGAGDLDEDEQTALVLGCAGEAIERLKAARLQEGAEITGVLLTQLDAIASLVAAAEAHPARGRAAIEARLREQLALLAADASLPQERIAQEALILATKADIQEELDRLRAHIAAARKLIAEGGPVGRRLDFLAQEFNREANTLCSKSNAVELTAIGLDLKAVIDQLREQIQNIE
ncbi:TIGR00255 family protein [Devosia lucknowensis]|uniref:TIGR00255 family protein n=1 Tax=Devosia lucknowensis TaxID=1096929 RepID=A0A1Y6EQ50_9HYPH|nr:YicC/YloC family endoribonuclease [Devosia lucknowensis]SMQ62303.1 TIGR00255 family protein [Devosia lucknowensis]